MNPNQPDLRNETPLSSWKEIAAYLQRNVATVRRWEKGEGLPVHRHSHQSRSSVYAYPSEIDVWRASRKTVAEPPPPLPLWKTVLAPPRSLAIGVTLAMCLVMVGNGIRPQVASAQEVSRRRVWAGPTVDRDASVTQDGRYFAFMLKKDNVTDIAVKDAATGEERRITNQTSTSVCRGSVDVPLISRDGKWVVYGVWDEKEWFELCVVNTIGEPAPRQLYRSNEVPFMEPYDWSPDGTQLAVSLSHRDRVSQIGLLSVSNGALRVLKTVGWDTPSELRFSPDGKYLAYDLMRGEDLEGRDIFVLAADGSRETLLVNTGYNAVLGWSADGKRVLFLKDRNGNMDIWIAPVEGTRPQGAASRVFANSGNMAPVGLTASGALYYAVGAQRDQQFRVAKMDFNAASLGPAGPATPGSAPQWSPDGQYVAFLAPQPRLRRNLSTIAVLSVKTDDVRYLRRTFSFNGGFRWAPDGSSFAVWGSIPNGRYGIYQVNAQSGKVSPIAVDAGEFREAVPPLDWSPDQRKIYYHRRTVKDDKLQYVSIVERTLATGLEKEVVRLADDPATRMVVSPDGRKLYYRRSFPNNAMAFFSIDLTTRAETELFRGESGQLN